MHAVFLRPEPTPEGGPDNLLAIAQIVDYTGLMRGTIDADISRGRIPSPDNSEHRVKRWKRVAIDSVMSKRRGYRRHREAREELLLRSAGSRARTREA
ncbi:hypothetical protein OIE66_18485 [Nonomuraea sp. NBC_01738]|uniref:helix-turn-helix transcriptional regulator n=1 Tax=Nonomuraea sp. NBC_01738 TaxID=2976003 RepID=UPI002E108B14|nr:hypothetical protein OIE66_18485 [Nonomuraea sp. NBC_01738]